MSVTRPSMPMAQAVLWIPPMRPAAAGLNLQPCGAGCYRYVRGSGRCIGR